MKKGLIVFIIFIVVVFVIGFFFVENIYQFGSTNSTNISINQVQIKDFTFSPFQITIKVGDTVTWINLDATPHTITSDTGDELKSPILASESTYSHTFKNAGTYPYHDSINTVIKGNVIVR
ncbi:MAG: cupredoxin domain-containing protein [Candidatus Nanoarchaeia archaeon]